MPALGLVDARAHAQGIGHGRHFHHGVGCGAPLREVGPDHHGFALAEAIGICKRFAHIGGAVGVHVGHGAQRFGRGRERFGHRLRVQPGGAQDAGFHAQFAFRIQQRLNAGAHAVLECAHHLAGLVGCFLFIVCAHAVRYAHDHQHGPRLFCDAGQRSGQGAQCAGFGLSLGNAGEQHRFVEGEGGGVGVAGRGHQANDGGGHHADAVGALGQFRDAHAVVKVCNCHG